MGNQSVGLATVKLPTLKPWFVKRWGEQIAKNLNLNVLSWQLCTYAPYAYTIVLFLAESHLAIETWPEKDNLVEITISSCQKFTKKDLIKALTYKPIRCKVLRGYENKWL